MGRLDGSRRADGRAREPGEQARSGPPRQPALVARNGRGKTTLLRTLAKSLKQIEGVFETKGRIQYLPEDLRFDPEITVSGIFNALLPSARRKEAADLAASLELDIRKDYGKLSTGNRRKAHLIVAELSVDPAGGNILRRRGSFGRFASGRRHARWRATVARFSLTGRDRIHNIPRAIGGLVVGGPI